METTVETLVTKIVLNQNSQRKKNYLGKYDCCCAAWNIFKMDRDRSSGHKDNALSNRNFSAEGCIFGG